MVVTGVSAAAATASATFDELFDPPASLVATVGRTCSPESRPRRVFGCRYARVSPLTWGCACIVVTATDRVGFAGFVIMMPRNRT